MCRWHGVGSWTWDAHDETCGICRMAFDGCCPDCKLPGDDCPLSKSLFIDTYFNFLFYVMMISNLMAYAVWGACNHAFHLHCILKWVNSQTPQAHCPMCRREWQFKEWIILRKDMAGIGIPFHSILEFGCKSLCNWTVYTDNGNGTQLYYVGFFLLLFINV